MSNIVKEKMQSLARLHFHMGGRSAEPVGEAPPSGRANRVKHKVTPGALSYAVASRLLQRSSCLELIQNRKGVERTASDQKRKIDRA